MRLSKKALFTVLMALFGILLFSKPVTANETEQPEDPLIKEILEWLKENEPDKKWEISIHTDSEGKVISYYAEQVFEEGDEIPDAVYGIIFYLPIEGIDDQTPFDVVIDERIPGETEEDIEELPGNISYWDIESPPVPPKQREAILALYNARIMLGYNNAFFGPFDSVLRGDVIKALWNAAGSPQPKSDSVAFKDTNISETYAKAVQWAYETGIAKGFSDGTFRPEDPCTRGQVITFIWRYKGSPSATSTKSPFKDIPLKHSFYNQIIWASDAGVSTGYSDRTFRSGKQCNRAQCAAFIYRALNSN